MIASSAGNITVRSMSDFARHVDLPSVNSPVFRPWYDARKKLSDLAWELHNANALHHYRSTRSAALRPSIDTTGLFDAGWLDATDTAALRGLFDQCPEIAFSADDFYPGYSFDPTGSLGAVNTYRRMTPAFEAKLAEVLAKIAPAVEEICGHYFRIVASHIWSLNRGPRNYQWHLDGWPVGIKKLFIYPAGADESRGSTAFRLKNGKEQVVEGPPGSWMIFENSAIEHKGMESLTDARPTIAISIAPSFRTDTSLFDAGANAGYPWFPLESAREGTETHDRLLRTVLETAGLATLLTPQGMVRDPQPDRPQAASTPRTTTPRRIRAALKRLVGN